MDMRGTYYSWRDREGFIERYIGLFKKGNRKAWNSSKQRERQRKMKGSLQSGRSPRSGDSEFV